MSFRSQIKPHVALVALVAASFTAAVATLGQLADTASAEISSWQPQLGGSCAQYLAADSLGYVYAADYQRVRRYTAQGQGMTSIGPSVGSSVRGLAAVPSGGVYVLGEDRSVTKYDAQGNQSAAFTYPYGSQTGRLQDPGAIASDRDGNFYIADAGQEKISKFDSAGAFVSRWGTSGNGPGQLNFFSRQKISVTVDGSGNVYVADENDRVQKFTNGGSFLAQWGGNGTGESQFQALYSISADSSGRLYAGDRVTGGLLKRFSTDGAYQGSSEPTVVGAVASASEDVVYASNCQGVFRLNLSTPTVSVSFPLRPVIGQPAKVVAQASVPFGEIVKYEYDLDGNGTFEQSSASPEATVTYDTPAVRTVTVRATSQLGGQATGSVAVRPVPPGAVGISINDGSYATNSESVTVQAVWPAASSAVTLSNDGGFGAAGGTKTLELAASLPWTMRDMGAEKVTRVVYARFDGSANATQTYSDDIVLDKLVPTLDDAELLGGSASVAAKSKRFRVKLRGSQKRSGISIAQFSAKRSGGVTVELKSRKVRGLRKLNKSVTVESKARPAYARIQSAAGTWSRWKKLKR